MSTKSLYNIAGFLGAQSRSNPSDHGDSWDSHRSAKSQECAFNLKRTDGLIPLNQLYQECLAIITEQPKLIPINPLTIKVGDTVKLIDNLAINAGFGQGLVVGSCCGVVYVGAADKGMPMQIADGVGDHIWMFAEDMLQVI